MFGTTIFTHVILTVLVVGPAALIATTSLRRATLMSDELLRLVNSDRLTGVATRDCFFSELAQCEASFGVSLMVDIDHFKRINDTHGHLAGDEVIRSVAERLRQNLREGDIICRFGGEEFLIFLDRADHQHSVQVAERMRSSVADQKIEVDGGAVFVTVSIGGASKAQNEDINAAIKAADDALYWAKGLGRNQTYFMTGALARTG
ncbi:GGDEF domain-containing protein [Yoonia sp. BS5-3]|uniref:diguanylate cyclase n=1 Tax=Yoonia phaeophyticola TaxID=3137369 RepID=A0ABZ2V6G0_9RHOB